MTMVSGLTPPQTLLSTRFATEITKMQLLPKKAIYYFTKADNKRAINEADLQLQAAKHGLLGERYPTVREAYTQCMKNALRDDFVFVGGSSYVVGDFLKIFK